MVAACIRQQALRFTSAGVQDLGTLLTATQPWWFYTEMHGYMAREGCAVAYPYLTVVALAALAAVMIVVAIRTRPRAV